MKGIIWTTNSTYQDGIEQLDKILEGYKKLNLNYYIKQRKNYTYSQIDNGDSWELCVTNDNARGRRCNIAYIHRSISNELKERIIMPSILGSPYRGIWYFGEEL